MPRITGVVAGGIAWEGGVTPGDELISINGEPVNDIFDYRFHACACELELLIRGADGGEWALDVEKPEDEDLGLVFDSELLDKPRACGNRCVFCFIDQLPRGMRKSLYFKDDDVRLSVLHGNYVTLTNVGGAELERIARYRLSPVNVSVHAADAALRARMLGAPAYTDACSTSYSPACSPAYSPAYDILPKLKYLTESGVAVNAQIVLCKGYNDGAALDETLGRLGGLNENLRSVSVVPAGLTKHRDGLPRLEAFDKAEARQILRQISFWQKSFIKSRNCRLVYAADELYILSGVKLPGTAAYDGYPQLENGVGMLALFKKQFGDALRSAARRIKPPITDTPVYILTGQAAAPALAECVEKFAAVFSAPKIRVIPVRNDFFGEQVTVSGLLSGGDLIKCLNEAGLPENSRVLISKNMLRSGSDMFLDDFTLKKLRNILKLDIIAVENDGRALIVELLRSSGAAKA